MTDPAPTTLLDLGKRLERRGYGVTADRYRKGDLLVFIPFPEPLPPRDIRVLEGPRVNLGPDGDGWVAITYYHGGYFERRAATLEELEIAALEALVAPAYESPSPEWTNVDSRPGANR